jgi:hypothetical protein
MYNNFLAGSDDEEEEFSEHTMALQDVLEAKSRLTRQIEANHVF